MMMFSLVCPDYVNPTNPTFPCAHVSSLRWASNAKWPLLIHSPSLQTRTGANSRFLSGCVDAHAGNALVSCVGDAVARLLSKR